MLQIELLPSLRVPEVRTKAANQVEFSTNTTPVRKSTMFWMKFRLHHCERSMQRQKVNTGIEWNSGMLSLDCGQVHRVYIKLSHHTSLEQINIAPLI